MPAHPTTEEAPWRAGLRGARANLVPGLVLQALALGLVLAYYNDTAVCTAVNRLGALNHRIGLLFGILSTMLFAGVLPFLYMKAMPSTRGRYTWGQSAALTVFLGYRGMEVSLLYRLLAWGIGAGTGVGTIAIKAVIDQFCYSPIFAVPEIVLAYDWCEHGFSIRALAAELRTPRWYARRVLPMLIANLGVWLPTVCLIYALPTPLQLPLQNFVMCFYSLIVAHISRRQSPNQITEARKSGNTEPFI